MTSATDVHRGELLAGQNQLELAGQALEKSTVHFDKLLKLQSRISGKYPRDWVNERTQVLCLVTCDASMVHTTCCVLNSSLPCN